MGTTDVIDRQRFARGVLSAGSSWVGARHAITRMIWSISGDDAHARDRVHDTGIPHGPHELLARTRGRVAGDPRGSGLRSLQRGPRLTLRPGSRALRPPPVSADLDVLDYRLAVALDRADQRRIWGGPSCAFAESGLAFGTAGSCQARHRYHRRTRRSATYTPVWTRQDLLRRGAQVCGHGHGLGGQLFLGAGR